MESEIFNMKYVWGAIIYSFLGLAILVASFVLLDVITPKVRMWKELVEEKNVAMGIFMGAIAISLGLIISSAIHG